MGPNICKVQGGQKRTAISISVCHLKTIWLYVIILYYSSIEYSKYIEKKSI